MFARWDVIEYKWQLPTKGDQRNESRRVEHKSVEIVGKVSEASRSQLLSQRLVTSLDAEFRDGRSLALIRPKYPRFKIVKKDEDVFTKQQEQFSAWHEHQANSLLGRLARNLVPYTPAPYEFRYAYSTDDGNREGVCQDWEVEATFLKWRKLYGEQKTLRMLSDRFGDEYPEKGFVLAMGTHKAYASTWLINGIIRLNHGEEDAIQLGLL